MPKTMSIRMLGVAFVAWAVAFFLPDLGKAEGGVAWSYSKEAGPAQWGMLSEDFFACSKGKNQSPIDITRTLDTDLPAIELSYRGETTDVVNNGHTVQIEMGPGSTMRLGEEMYTLTQFHVHSPSEHRIGGESFPLEAHFVHQNDRGELAVISVLFRLGERHEGLAWLGANVPVRAGSQPVVTKIEALDVMPEGRAHFRYHGSLTTPPCTEGITWLVLTETSRIAQEQVDRFIELIGEDSRPLQPLNGRLVLH